MLITQSVTGIMITMVAVQRFKCPTIILSDTVGLRHGRREDI